MNTADGISWVAVALAGVSMVGTAIGAVTAALVKIAQTRADAKTAALESQNKIQAGQIDTLTQSNAACAESHAATEAKLENCEKKHETMELRVEQIEAVLATKKDDTAEHKPLTPPRP